MIKRVFSLKSLCLAVALMVGLGAVGEGTSAQAATQKSKASTTKKAVAKKPVRKVAASAKKPVRKLAQKKSRAKVLAKGNSTRQQSVMSVSAPPRLSVGQQLGLHSLDDPLDLNSSVALVIDQDTREVLFRKNDAAVLPIASLTKLMTGLVIADAGLDMRESITITSADIDTVKGSRSRLAVGTTLSREELMHLSLMSSENRAAHALGRTFPGGMQVFVHRMNQKAVELGMNDTRYVEPTGLSSENRSSARDLATLVAVAHGRPMLRDLSTSPGHEIDVGQRTLQYNNSNRLVKNPDWEIGLQKTGYISEAGRCLVMQARVAGRQLIMVFLDATGKLSRLQDAERVRRWVELQSPPLEVSTRPQG